MNQSPLPPGVLPRGLYRAQAAAYVGVGVTKFDAMVADRRMPSPRRVDGRKIWDRRELDEHFDALPHDDDADEGPNPWDEEAA